MIHNGLWGEWKPWTSADSHYVCGSKVRFEDPIGDGDDTALNGISFKFCELKVVKDTKLEYDLDKREVD